MAVEAVPLVMVVKAMMTPGGEGARGGKWGDRRLTVIRSSTVKSLGPFSFRWWRS